MSTAQAESETVADEGVRTWLDGFVAGWRAPRGADAFAAHFHDMLAPDVRLIQPLAPTLRDRRAFLEQFVKPLFALIPDIRGDVERWAARGDTLFVELTLSGTLAGRPIRFRACDRVTLRDGRAVERESYLDPAPLVRAVARSPSVWPRFLQMQLRNAVEAIRARRKR